MEHVSKQQGWKQAPGPLTTFHADAHLEVFECRAAVVYVQMACKLQTLCISQFVGAWWQPHP